jgi:hypothetical protein
MQLINAVQHSAQIITATVKISTDLQRPLHAIFNIQAVYDYIRRKPQNVAMDVLLNLRLNVTLVCKKASCSQKSDFPVFHIFTL